MPATIDLDPGQRDAALTALMRQEDLARDANARGEDTDLAKYRAEAYELAAHQISRDQFTEHAIHTARRACREQRALEGDLARHASERGDDRAAREYLHTADRLLDAERALDAASK